MKPTALMITHGALARRALVEILATTALITACGRDAGKKEEDTSASAAMPGMPGMRDSADPSSFVTFTAAQIAHGRVAWAVPAQTTMSGTVEVPGQLVPNEDRTARLAASAQARVLAVHVSPGERVARGGRLVTLQSQEGSMAQADAAKANAELSSRRAAAAYAKAAKDRAERLL